MDAERLVQMANDIANYFASDPDREEGIAGMVSHIERFWEPRMRRQIVAHLDAGGDGFGELARDAITHLSTRARAA